VRIHAITRNRDGCFEHRIALPLAHLGRLDHDTSYGDGAGAALLDELSAEPDSVLIGKFLTDEYAVSAWEKISSNPRRPRLMVYDVDDAYQFVSQVHGGDRSVYAHPDTILRSQRVMRAADLITCSTPALAELYEDLAPTVVLPNAIPDEVFEWGARTPPAAFTVGFQGSPSHLQDFQYWLPAYDDFMRGAVRTDGTHAARWHWFGMTDPRCWPAHRQRCTPWEDTPEKFYRGMLGKFHVGVAPLHPGLEFNAYKSGLKAQVYAALRVPVVASDTEFFRDVVGNGRTGILCDTRAAWTDSLMYLYESPGDAAAMGMRAYDAEYRRRMSAVAPLWEQAYRKAMQ
jgi:glycosyltransferase involved in cell wall biosynthesis